MLPLTRKKIDKKNNYYYSFAVICKKHFFWALSQNIFVLRVQKCIESGPPDSTPQNYLNPGKPLFLGFSSEPVRNVLMD